MLLNSVLQAVLSVTCFSEDLAGSRTGLENPGINKKAILVCSTNYSRSDAFPTKDGKNELLL